MGEPTEGEQSYAKYSCSITTAIRDKMPVSLAHRAQRACGDATVERGRDVVFSVGVIAQRDAKPARLACDEYRNFAL